MSKTVDDLSMSTDTISPRVWFYSSWQVAVELLIWFPQTYNDQCCLLQYMSKYVYRLPSSKKSMSLEERSSNLSKSATCPPHFYHLSGDCALHHRSPGCIFVDLGQHAGTVSSRWCSLGGQRWTDWFVGERFGGRNVVDRIYHPPKNTQRAPSKNP